MFLFAPENEPHLPKSKISRPKNPPAKAARKSATATNRFAPSDMPPGEFRELGHTLVDAIADFYQRLPHAPTASPLLPDALRKKLGRRGLPQNGTDISPVLQDVARLFFEQS